MRIFAGLQKTVLAVLFLSASGVPAFAAASYEIYIRRMDAAENRRSVTCPEEEVCFLALPVYEEDDDEYIDVAIRLSSGIASLQFLKNGEYLWTSSMGARSLQIPVNAEDAVTGEVILYIPNPLEDGNRQDSLLQQPVVRQAGAPVAVLEIGIKLL